jgi:hypothetical protein
LEDGFRQCQEAYNEGTKSYTIRWPPLEITNDAKDSESCKVFEKNIAAADKQSIHHGIAVFLVVTRIRGEVSLVQSVMAPYQDEAFKHPELTKPIPVEKNTCPTATCQTVPEAN